MFYVYITFLLWARDLNLLVEKDREKQSLMLLLFSKFNQSLHVSVSHSDVVVVAVLTSLHHHHHHNHEFEVGLSKDFGLAILYSVALHNQ